MIAWLSMAVDPTAIPGRISMVMMTLLTLMAMFSGVRQNTPKVRAAETLLVNNNANSIFVDLKKII